MLSHNFDGKLFIETSLFIPGKSKATTQLKVNSLEIHQSSPQSIRINHGQHININCSAFGNAKEMNGRITTSKIGSSVQFKVERGPSGNQISVKATVHKEGLYLCEIQNKAGKKVQASIHVEISMF